MTFIHLSEMDRSYFLYKLNQLYNPNINVKPAQTVFRSYNSCFPLQVDAFRGRRMQFILLSLEPPQKKTTSCGVSRLMLIPLGEECSSFFFSRHLPFLST